MVMTVANVKDAAYYDKAETYKNKNVDRVNKKTSKENYYSEDNESPGTFFGKGAEALGLIGEANTGALTSLVNGFHPKTKEKLYAFSKAKWQAVDCCFSAPKDFSLLANFDKANEHLYQKIFNDAVKDGVNYLHSIAYRKTNKSEQLQDIKLISIIYNHETARPVDDIRPDPQKHAHVITLRKALKDCERDDKFVSIDNYAFFNNQKVAGAIFRRSLANNLRKLGYKIDRIRDTYVDDKNKKVTVDSFKIVGITDKQRAIFSNRSESLKQEIGHNATSMEKQITIYNHRQNKIKWDDDELKFVWNNDAKKVGLNREFFNEIKNLRTNIKQLTNKEIIKKASWKGKLFERSLFIAALEQEQFSGVPAEKVVGEMLSSGLITKIDKFNYSINFDLTKVNAFSENEKRNINTEKAFTQKTKRVYVEKTAETKKATTQISEVAKVDVVKSAKSTIKKISDKTQPVNISNPVKSTAKNVGALVSSYSIETIKNSISHIAFMLNNPNLSTAEVAKLMQMKAVLMQQLDELEKKQKLKIS